MPDELIQLTDNFWCFPCDNGKVEATVGVVCTLTQTVLLDAGNSPNHARRVLRTLDALHAPPVRYVIYTHHHWDHTFGAMVFDAPAIAHEAGRTLLLRYASLPWNAAYLEAEMRADPIIEPRNAAMLRAFDDWSDFRIVVPSITFSERMTLDLNGVTLEVVHVGGLHTRDSLVVSVRESGVKFLGDCFYPAVLHERKPDSTLDWTMLESLVDDATQIYLDGHNPPAMSAEEFVGRWVRFRR